MEPYEEIIKEVIKKYPVGTIVDSLGGTENAVITSDKPYFNDINFIRFNEDCAVYDVKTKEWARIISYVEPVITIHNNYEIY